MIMTFCSKIGDILRLSEEKVGETRNLETQTPYLCDFVAYRPIVNAFEKGNPGNYRSFGFDRLTGHLLYAILIRKDINHE
jgi:hypothetical protein